MNFLRRILLSHPAAGERVEIGQRKVVNIIELEPVLREMEFALASMRDCEKYSLVMFGQPDATAHGDIVRRDQETVAPLDNRGLAASTMTETQRARAHHASARGTAHTH